MDIIKIIDMSDKEEEINAIERVYYEVQAYENISVAMLERGYTKNDNFYKDYWEEYLSYLKIFEIMKKNFSDKYLSEYPNLKWKLQFSTKQVIIYNDNKI